MNTMTEIPKQHSVVVTDDKHHLLKLEGAQCT